MPELKLNKYIFRFEDDDNMLVDSALDYFYSSTHDYKFMKSIEDDDEESEEHKAVVLKFEVIKFNTFIYTPYVLINKTDLPLVFGDKKDKSASIPIPPNSREFFNSESGKKKKFSIATDNYDWTDPFDITTLGMSEETALQRLDNFNAQDKFISKYSSNKLNLVVLISNLCGQYSKTTAIKIVPRYIFVKNWSKPVVLAQDNKNACKQYWISPGNSTVYHFENKANKDNFIKIREPYNSELDESKLFDWREVETTHWSSRFSIDDFEDFQVSVQSAVRDDVDQVDKSEDVKEDVLEAEDQDKDFVINDKQDKKLYELSKLSQFSRFVRIIITTQDEATLFIVLCDPNMPEYRISNMTSKKVLVYQKDAKERTIVRTWAKAKFVKVKDKVVDIISYLIPFVWDDQSMDDKKIVVEIDGEHREYDLDEIEEK